MTDRGSPRQSPARRTTSQYVPRQHGAWAFLGLPLVLGALVAPPSWLVPVLAVAWVAAYPWSYAALRLARPRGRDRFRRPLLVWSAVVVPPVALLVVSRPWLVWVGLALLALFAVNVAHARRNDERSLANDAVLVVECTAMVPVTWAVAVGGAGLVPPEPGRAPTALWVLTVTCALVLAGSTLHVKSLIRERRDPRFARASRVVSVASLAGSVGLGAWLGSPAGLWLVVPFAVLAVRSFAVTTRQPVVAVGLVELGGFLVVAAAAALAV